MKKKTVLSVLPVTLIVAAIVQSTVLALMYQSQHSTLLKKQYLFEYAKLHDPLQLLGVSNQVSNDISCLAPPALLRTTVNCTAVKHYSPNALLHPLSASAVNALPTTSKMLTDLLANNSWQFDRSSSSATSLTVLQNSQTMTSKDASYTKNIGVVQCGITISYNYVDDSLDANYQCSIKYHYYGFHF